MFNTLPKSAGFTLIEVMVAIAIIGIMVSLGIPSYREWVQNTQIRNAAESIQNGLQRARAEAVGRNTNVEFILNISGDSSWGVSAVNPAAMIDSRSAKEGSRNIVARGFAADGLTAAAIVTFNNFAGISSNADGTPTLRQIDLDSTKLDPADSRNLSVRIGAAGVGSNIRMCDPNLAVNSSPRAC